MHKYLVTFHKVVLDSCGYDHRIVQQRVIITARSDVSALYEAKARFCEAMRVVDWRLRADSCEIADLAFLAA
jgi:hypothetical protein